MKGASDAQPWTAPEGVAALSGVVEYLTPERYDALLRLDNPGPGVAARGTFCFPGGGSTMRAINFYLYGDQAAGNLARLAPVASVAPGTLPGADASGEKRMTTDEDIGGWAYWRPVMEGFRTYRGTAAGGNGEGCPAM